MEFPNASGKRINMMYPTDYAYWTKLKAFVNYEPVEAISAAIAIRDETMALETRAYITSLGHVDAPGRHLTGVFDVRQAAPRFRLHPGLHDRPASQPV
jgi:hypothetical protein